MSQQSEQSAKTGVGPTTLVAVEQHFPRHQRVVHDPLAYRILPLRLKAFVWLFRPAPLRNFMVNATERDAPGLWAAMMCRKRYIDERLLEALDDTDAVINLGAGFDTRLYRLPGLDAKSTWEIDQFQNIKAKKDRLRHMFGAVPDHASLVALDFNRQDPMSVLQWQGCPLDRPAFYIMEAVTQYLTREGVRKTFNFLAQAAPGSRLTFTYVLEDFLSAQTMYGWEKAYADYVESGLWTFGMNPPAWPDFLAQYGWQIVEDVGYGRLAPDYIQPTGRNLATTPIERLIYAQKQ